jgi:hypothetical protein
MEGHIHEYKPRKFSFENDGPPATGGIATVLDRIHKDEYIVV